MSDTALMQRHRTHFIDARELERRNVCHQRDRLRELGVQRAQRAQMLRLLKPPPRKHRPQATRNGMDEDEMQTARLLLSTGLSVHRK